MNQRSIFLLQSLEKIGAPLMAAISAAGPAGEGSEAASLMAEMVTACVQISVALGEIAGPGADPDNAESVRMALTALAAPLVANHFRQHGQVPQEADLDKIVKALQTIVTFAENFTPSEGVVKRLGGLDTAIQSDFDEDQATLLYMRANLPVLEAAAEFSFGQSETRLAQDIAKELETRGRALRESLFAVPAGSDEARYIELMIFGTLARLYAECHKAATSLLLAQGGTEEEIAKGDGQPDVSLESVWGAFDVKLAMLETILAAMHPGADEGTAASAGGTAAAPAQPQMPEQTQAPTQPQTQIPPQQEQGQEQPQVQEQRQEQQPPAELPPAQPEKPPADTPQQATGPMSFFKPGAQSGDEDSEA